MGDRTRPRYTFEQFTAVRRYQPTLTFSPDGGEVAYSTDTSGQFNLWRQDTAGGYPHQLTLFADQAVRQIAWAPDGTSILFTADRQGDEFHQVYRIPARGGRPEPLTDAPTAQHFLADRPWSPDGRAVAYSANDRAPTDQDVIVRDLDGAEVGRPLAGDAYYHPVAWSPDGRQLTALEVKSNADFDVHLVSLDDGGTRRLTPHEGEARDIPGPWAADGTGFYLITDEGRQFLGLAFYRLDRGALEWIETPEWDVEAVTATPDGRYLAWVVNEGGASRLFARDLTSGESVSLPELPEGVISLLEAAPSGTKLGLRLSRPQHPAELFVLDLTAGTIIQLTHGFLGRIPEEELVRPELVTYPTHDGRDIPAFLYRPPGDGPFPVVLSIHGGPEGQERPTYDGLYQYLLSRGIGIFAPNVRGSTGYGRAYQKLIYHDWGGAELGDFAAAAEYLRGLPWVDGTRLGVFGGSFGGFAVLSCVSRLPDLWAAAVDIVGPSNLITLIETGPPTWRRFDAELIGDPETEREFLLARSPVTYADQITAPLFVIQGANDPRVPQGESDQIVQRLRDRGVAVRYDVYPDEGHGFTKRENELKALRDTAAFFEQHLLQE